jgi:hypothetical protein
MQTLLPPTVLEAALPPIATLLFPLPASRAALPIAIFSVPVVLFSNAPNPIATLLSPVVLFFPAFSPKKEFLVPRGETASSLMVFVGPISKELVIGSAAAGAASVISVPLNVNTSLADAPDCNPGILKDVTLVLPKVISFVAVAEEACAFLPITVRLLPLVTEPPAASPKKVLSAPVALLPELFPTATLFPDVTLASNEFLPIATLLTAVVIDIPALDPSKVLLPEPVVKPAPASPPNAVLLLPSG